MKEFKKEYDRRDDLVVQLAKEKERLHIIRCKLNNWDRGLIHAQENFDAFKTDYDDSVKKLQLAEIRYQNQIKKLEGKHQKSSEKVISDAHPNKSQCEYCKRWLKDLTRHECKKIPKEILQAQKAEEEANKKAIEDAEELARLEVERMEQEKATAEAKRKIEEAEMERLAQKLIEEEKKAVKRIAEAETKRIIEEKRKLEVIEELPQATYENPPDATSGTREFETKINDAGEVEFKIGTTDATIEIPEPYIKETADTELEKARAVSEQIGQVKEAINHEIKDIEWLTAKRQNWIDSYNEEEGGKAIWQGRLTNGFKSWCESKGYKIGD